MNDSGTQGWGEININGLLYPALSIVEILENLVTGERKKKFNSIIEKRIFHVVPILENICDNGNLNAVLRSAESLGFPVIHCVRSEKVKKSNRVTKGCHKWLQIMQFKQIEESIGNLRKNNFRIYSTDLRLKSKKITEIDMTQKTAIIFGNEKEGVSKKALALSDDHCFIPMYGFSQSFNISVAAGIVLNEARRQNEANSLLSAQSPILSLDEEKNYLLANYYLNAVAKSREIVVKAIRTTRREKEVRNGE